MKINRHIQTLGSLEYGPEFFIIQVFALGMGIELCPFHSQLCYGTL